MSGTGVPRDALGRDRAESEAHRPAKDRRVVVHRRQDERVRERDAAERDGKARIVAAEDVEVVEREMPKAPLPERHRHALGQA